MATLLLTEVLSLSPGLKGGFSAPEVAVVAVLLPAFVASFHAVVVGAGRV